MLIDILTFIAIVSLFSSIFVLLAIVVYPALEERRIRKLLEEDGEDFQQYLANLERRHSNEGGDQ